MTEAAKPILVVMARRPEPGCVKTRLEPALGPGGARNFYAAMLEDILDASIDPRWRTVVALTPGEAVAEPGPWVGMETLPQEGDNLAERAVGVFQDLLGRGRPVVMRTSDGPDLPIERIAEAFAALEDDAVDLVVGPDLGRGFYLIGLKRAIPELFGAPGPLGILREDFMARARDLGLGVRELAPEADVDTPADLDALGVRLGLSPSRRGLCPRSVALLKSLDPTG